MRNTRYIFVGLVLCWATGLAAANKPIDGFGKPDKITIEVAPLAAKGQWVAAVVLENDEELAAITIPLKFGERVGQFKLDSVRFDNTRVSYFALKTTNSHDSLNSVLVGLMYEFGGDRPPLAPGIGQVARLYFTQQGKPANPPVPPAIDSTFFLPYNTLGLVTPSAEAITPIFETVRMEKLTEFKLPQEKKAAKPTEKPH